MAEKKHCIVKSREEYLRLKKAGTAGGCRELTDDELSAVSGGGDGFPSYIYWCSNCTGYLFEYAPLSECPICHNPVSRE